MYLIWQEGRGPGVVFEITSASSRVADQGTKRAIYAMLGVQKYFLFDPLAEYLPRQVRGYRRQGDELIPMMREPLHSECLGLDLVVQDRLLRLCDPATGESFRTYSEAEAALVRERKLRLELEARLRDQGPADL
ncbi:MAG: Uma2 family endonuclease [Armatimonadetes bacterium]|nr:Uma2 family endonuclease [Armatimonadota bacterium]